MFSDTSIAELIKEVTDSEEFLDALRTQQGITNQSVQLQGV